MIFKKPLKFRLSTLIIVTIVVGFAKYASCCRVKFCG